MSSPTSPSIAPSHSNPALPPTDAGDYRSSKAPPRAPRFSFLPSLSSPSLFPCISLRYRSLRRHKLAVVPSSHRRRSPDPAGTRSDGGATLGSGRPSPPRAACIAVAPPPPRPWLALAIASTPLAGRLWSTGGHDLRSRLDRHPSLLCAQLCLSTIPLMRRH